jgi:hypothetical protein
MKSCKEITYLASRALDEELPLSQRIGIQVHMMMCKYCSRYAKQLKFLRTVMSGYLSEQADELSQCKLPEESARQIQHTIDKNL